MFFFSVALSVLSKKQHLKGNELKVLPYAPKDEGTNRKIVVKGINNIIETEMLEMYFENKRKSGGGEIEKFEWIDESVIITFENLEGK